MKRNLLVLMCLVMPIIGLAQDMSKHYKVYDVKKQKTINLDDIISDLANANVLFFGEEHNLSLIHI